MRYLDQLDRNYDRKPPDYSRGPRLKPLYRPKHVAVTHFSRALSEDCRSVWDSHNRGHHALINRTDCPSVGDDVLKLRGRERLFASERLSKVMQAERPGTAMIAEVGVPRRSNGVEPGVCKAVKIDCRAFEQSTLRFARSLVGVERM
jgi:hypothetical protein